jgi:ABC-type transporter Mla MlaB component
VRYLGTAGATAYAVNVRASGLLDQPAGVERADHVCWAYDDDASFEEAAVRFLGEGLAHGDRLLWVGDGAGDRLRRSAGPLADVEGLAGRGILRLLAVGDGYAPTGSFSPDQQLAFYDAATREALEDGYRGLRVVAEITALAADPARRADLLRWEHLADDYVAHGPGFSALCAYRADVLPPEAVADATAVHPVSPSGRLTSDFRLWFDEGRLVLAGEVDASGADRLARLLESTHLDAPLICLDLSRLDFADLAGVRTVARWAERLRAVPARVELVGAPRLFRRIWALLDLGDRVDVFFPEPRR